MHGRRSGSAFTIATALCSVIVFSAGVLYFAREKGYGVPKPPPRTQEVVRPAARALLSGPLPEIAPEQSGEISNRNSSSSFSHVEKSFSAETGTNSSQVEDQSLTFFNQYAPRRSSADGSTDEYQVGDATGKKTISKAIEAVADSSKCGTCTYGRVSGISVPASCTYISYTLTQIHRAPFASIKVRDDGTTSYSETLDPDAKGRVRAFRLSLSATRVDGNLTAPSIAMRLTVKMQCSQAAIDGS